MEPRIMQPNPWLIGTSLAFLLPLGYTLRHRQTLVMAAALWLVVIVSTIYHATKDPILFWIDQLAVFTLGLSALYFGLKQGGAPLLITVIVVAGCAAAYYGGWLFDSLIWSEHFTTATASHALMHLWVIGGIVLATTTVTIV